MSPTPEQQARIGIDAALEAAGWIVQDRAAMNLAAGPGVAVREFKMESGHGFADYLLFVNGKAAGVLEAKPAGYALTNVELQADKYATGLPVLSFSAGAVDFASRIDSKIVLIDGAALAKHMIDHIVGVSVARSYEVKRIDSHYFSED